MFIILFLYSTTVCIGQTAQDYLKVIKEEGVSPLNFIQQKIDRYDLLIFDDALHSAVEPFEYYQELINDFGDNIDYVFIEDNDRLIIQPTQTDYKTSEGAIASIGNGSFIVETGLATEALLIGWIVHKGNVTDLSDTAESLFVGANKFGTGTSTVVGGT